MTDRKLTDADRVLLALAHAANGTLSPVPYEEIVIESWRRFPQRFSLRNHPEFPDSSDQHKRLYTTLRQRGLVEALHDKNFRLTSDGLSRAQHLDHALEGTVPTEGRARPSRDLERILRNALTSDAWMKWRQGAADRIVDFDARAFFGFAVGTSPTARVARVRGMRRALDEAERRGVHEAPELRDLLSFLIIRFGEELQIADDHGGTNE